MKFPTMDEFAKNVAEKALDEVEYNGKTIREWVEIILATEHSTNLAEVGTDCSEFPNNSDTISRQKARNAICNACGKIDCDEMNTCKKLDIPSEESKALGWQYHTYIPHNKYCPKCGKDSPYNKRWNFCPNCGADMREVTT